MIQVPSPPSYGQGVRGAIAQLPVEAQLREEQHRHASTLQRLAYLERENEVQRASIQRLAHEKGESEGRLVALEEETGELQNDLLFARQQLQTVSAKLRNVEADNNTFREQNNALRSRIDSVSPSGGSSATIAELEEQLASWQTHYQQQYQEFQQYCAALQGKLQDSEAARTENLETVAMLQRGNEDKEAMNEKLRMRIIEMEEEQCEKERTAASVAAAAKTPQMGSAVPASMATTAPAPAPAPKPRRADPYDDPDFQPKPLSAAPVESEGLRKRAVLGGGGVNDTSAPANNSNGKSGNGKTQKSIVNATGAQTQKLPAFVRILWLLILIAIKSALIFGALLWVLVALELDGPVLAWLPEALKPRAVHMVVDTIKWLLAAARGSPSSGGAPVGSISETSVDKVDGAGESQEVGGDGVSGWLSMLPSFQAISDLPKTVLAMIMER